MKKGFIRVSKNAEQLQQEIKKLNQHGVPSDSIFLERNLSLVLPHLEKGDTIVVCSLAHICTGMKDLLSIICEILKKGIGFESVDEYKLQISPEDTQIIDLLSSLNRFRQDIAGLRITEGLDKAINEGKKLGRPSGMTSQMAHKIKLAKHMYEMNQMSISQICRQLKLNQGSFYRYIKYNK